ncbi:MAG: flagellin [Neomegalonema sp.]|nr:flagellin [Neomegalonema sp.]
MSSILTNTSAMTALQTLKATNNSLNDTQNMISTGKKVATARDNAAIWAVSTVMQADVDGFNGISESLALGESTVAVAQSAAEEVTSLLREVKEKIVAAKGENIDRAKIQTDIVALRDQVASIVSSAQFNGTNLLVADAADPSLDVLASLDRDSTGTVTPSYISVNRIDLTQAAGGGLELLAGIDVTAAAPATDPLDDIETLIQTSVDAAAAFGSAQNRLEIQGSFVGKLVDSMTTGIGSLVDADMEEASARLQALQVQQQLGTQALSIANQGPQNLLSLFR